MTLKEELHEIVDELPEHELDRVLDVLRYLHARGSDPALRALVEAPLDDEPTTPEEDQSAEGAWGEYQRGLARPWEEVRKELARG